MPCPTPRAPTSVAVLVLALASLGAGPTTVPTAPTAPAALTPPASLSTQPAPPRFRAGRLDAPAVAESSGLAASRAHPGVFWTHNDSGNPAELFAVTSSGALRRTYAVAAANIDWEDVAIDDRGRLYVGDIGNNARNRREVYVHAVVEPDPAVAQTAAAPQVADHPATDRPAGARPAAGGEPPLPVERTWTLRYPDRPFDAEALVVRGPAGYVISKRLDFGKATIYAFDLDPARPAQTLRAVAELPIRFPVTAASLSADGRWLAVMTVRGPYLFRIDGDVAAAAKADAAGAGPKQVTFVHPKMEACAVTPDGVLATTEDRDVLLFRWADFGVEDDAER